MSTCLVTGGAGFIGSHLVDALLADGNEVVVLDSLSTGILGNLAHNMDQPRFRFVQGDVLHDESVREVMPSCDVVYHLAAARSGPAWTQDDAILSSITTNVHGTASILGAAYELGCKVVFLSSAEVYGKGRGTPLQEDDDRVLGPTHMESWSFATAKAFAEHLCFLYYEKRLPVVVVRPFTVYGPRCCGGMVAGYVRQALRGEPITVRGQERQEGNLIYVTDVARGMVLAGQQDKAEGQILNLGSDVLVSAIELAMAVKETVGSASEIMHLPGEIAWNPEDAWGRTPDTSRAKELLGFEAQVSLEEGLRRTVAWMRERSTL